MPSGLLDLPDTLSDRCWHDPHPVVTDRDANFHKAALGLKLGNGREAALPVGCEPLAERVGTGHGDTASVFTKCI